MSNRISLLFDLNKSLNIAEKIVLGTAQFGIDYGIANLNGKLAKDDVFKILTCAWEKGVRRFDTAPSYGTESLLGEFFKANSLREEIKILTKLPSLDEVSDYKTAIRKNIDASLKNLGAPIEVLLFHKPSDSGLLLTDPQFFEDLLHNYPVSTLGVSVYEPKEVETLTECLFELAFQFPLNVLDRRFKKVSMPKGMRYGRSIFLQGLLATGSSLRLNAPLELFNLQQKYHDKLAKYNLDPVHFAVSFVVQNDYMDFILIGVDSVLQLLHILNLDLNNQKDKTIFFDTLVLKSDERWLDPRNWR